MNEKELEARALIEWGTAPEEVVSVLVGGGMSDRRARAVVARFQKKREGALVRRGYRRLLVGSLVCLLTAIAFGFLVSQGAEIATFPRVRRVGFLFLGSVVGFLWGLWKLMDGVRDAVRPESVRDNLGTQGADFL